MDSRKAYRGGGMTELYINELMRQYREIGIQYGWLQPHEKVKMSEVLQAYKALTDFLGGVTSLAKEIRRNLQDKK